jgi:hypothetical protein
MAIVLGFILVANFIVVLSLSIGMAMQGDFRGLIALAQIAGILVALVAASWVPVLTIRAARWSWRKLTNG